MSDSSYILKDFKKDNGNIPKSENISLQVLRLVKKSLRCIELERKLKEGPYSLQENFQLKKLMIWHELEIIYYTDRKYFEEQSKVVKFSKNERVKSGNQKFISQFFNQPKIKTYYLKSIELWFYEAKPESLCKKFEMLCCNDEMHSEVCERKWENFKMKYLMAEIFKNSKNEEVGKNDEKFEDQENSEIICEDFENCDNLICDCLHCYYGFKEEKKITSVETAAEFIDNLSYESLSDLV